MSVTENYNGDCSTFGAHEPSFGMTQQIRRVGIDRWTAAGWQGGTSEHWDALDRAFGDEAMQETHSSLEPLGSPYSGDSDCWVSDTRLTCQCLPLARKSPERGIWRDLYLNELIRLKVAWQRQLEAERVPF